MIASLGFYRKFIYIIVISIVGIFLSFNVKAAIISPDKYYLDIQNSNLEYQKLVIYSTPNQEKPITYKVKTIGIKKVGENNDRAFYEADTNDEQEASNWIKIIDSEVTVNPGDTIEVRWGLIVPSTFNCETKLAGIAVSEVESGAEKNSGTNVSIGNEVISQVHINTLQNNSSECAYYENLILQEFNTTQSIPIYNYDNIEFNTLIENKSDYLSRNIKGYIEIIGFGEKEVIEFNDTNLDIYPHSYRSFINKWIDKDYPQGDFIQETIYELTHLKIGMYTARLGITKNIEKPIISSKTIIILPIRVIVLCITLLLIVLYIIKENINTRSELRSLRKNNAVKKALSVKRG